MRNQFHMRTHDPHIHTPFKSLLPEAGKILTYLEAIRRPKAHIVKTLTIGKTAILIEPNNDCPPGPSVSRAINNLPIVAIINTTTSVQFF